MRPGPEAGRILALLEGKKISSVEAAELLEALGDTSAQPEAALHIRVYEGEGRPKADLRVPLSWAKFLAPLVQGKVLPWLAARGAAADMPAIAAAVERGEAARVLDVQAGADRLEIFID